MLLLFYSFLYISNKKKEVIIMNKNVEKVFNLKLTEDMVRELQVLGAEVDARAYVIDSMFENHKTDTDNSIFTSVPFQAYQKELIEYRRAYDKEVERLGEKLIPMVQEYLGIDEIDFDWRVEDFSKLEVEITVK